MRKVIMAAALLLLAGGSAFAGEPNTLSKEEQKAGWVLLWDGKSLDGWVAAINGKVASDGWYIEDGTLCTRKFEGDRKTIVDIRTTKKYTDFILKLQVKITPGANSGIKYFIQDNMAVGCEYQVLDNDIHPDGKKGVNGNRTFASLYDLIPADKEKAKYTIGGWNDVKIVVHGNHAEHWLNGVKVLDYYRHNQAFDALVQCSKFATQKNFGKYDSGYILLQNHQDAVAYRDIKIKEL